MMGAWLEPCPKHGSRQSCTTRCSFAPVNQRSEGRFNPLNRAAKPKPKPKPKRSKKVKRTATRKGNNASKSRCKNPPRTKPLPPWLTVPQPVYYPQLGVWLTPTVETSTARFEQAKTALDMAIQEVRCGTYRTRPCKCRAYEDGFLVCWNCRTV